MDGNGSWKKTEEVQIDLPDLLRSLLAGWKQAVICMLAAAVLLGGYGWMKNGGVAAGVAGIEGGELTEEEEQAVEDALQVEEELAELEDYVEHSILMQANPYRKNQVFFMFLISGATNHTISGISESYLGFLTNGGAVDVLQKADGSTWKMDKRYLGELIAARLKSDGVYQVVAVDEAQAVPAEALLYVEVTGKDAKMAAKLAEDLQDALEGYSDKVGKQCGKHKLALVSSQDTVRIDYGLLAQQDEKKQTLKAKQESLKSMTEGFHKQQKELYKKHSSRKGQADEKEEREDGEGRIPVKYLLFGLAGGIGIYCAWFAFSYMMRDTVKSAREFRACYNLPFFGSISLQEGGKKKRKGMRDYEREKALVLNRTRLACKKQGAGTLCLAAGFEPDAKGRTCLDELSKQLEEWGITVVFVDKAGENTAQWDAVAEAGNVLLVCKAGDTTHREIDEEMEFYLENGVAVIGAAVLER